MWVSMGIDVQMLPGFTGMLHSSLQLPILQGYRVIVQVVIKLTQRTIHIYMYKYIYIYIHIERERERERQRDREICESC